ncbi:hydrogen peroxide-inducible genes activator [Wohlfahrtiimonas chitiniclastica]|uniref:Hydrogen peroxide-inducible genes activator n=2 Tax=Wohlfahrtiimonas chitiniclastica TaxID=400946 RepID=L8Y0L3_9GAMM|nr:MULTISPECIES: hydrogen peroxide-inducible genes activator [Wohlfahrtiimonas]ELV08031.1 Hydrogen peroxide-inducible genes activator [Wohlfahrtiimonas chitiniclastica SH04]KZX36564.1 hydrogen peroxide-inducible activator [Wohlfahrtiimonas chitiniclastica]MBS7814442.1 hydrogen peroxide-inducible genes activator [Wohlfahrtiimonas chitiniclastica]MBS7816463.1 hydrogen peroxide-inducible genes activator [Wohlfahrtiimonas chitiniclastica]MBS7818400.1 hydrogen peroxide-inducible genes activator [Wo
MKLNELRYFLAVAEEKHFGRAAQKCFISQPALSIGIKNLEYSLGVTLFERSASEVFLTPEGLEALPKVKQIFAIVQQLKELRVSINSAQGELKLGIIFTIAPYLLPRVIPVLKEAAPELTLNIFENTTDNIIPMLKSGEIDAAIVALPIYEPSLAVDELYDEEFYVITPKHHPLSGESSIDAAVIHEYDPLLLNIGHCFRDQVVEQCPEISSNNAHHYSLETIRNIVASGQGISVLPKYALINDHVQELIACIPFKAPVPKRKIGLVYRKEYTQLKKLELLSECIKSLHL